MNYGNEQSPFNAETPAPTPTGSQTAYQFDAGNHEVSSGEFAPPGEYMIAMKTSEWRTSAAGNDYLACKFEIVEGDFKGNIIFENLNLNHSKPEVSQMAKDILSRWCKACNIDYLNDFQDLYGASFGVLLANGKPNNNGDVYLKIKKVF